PELFFNEYDFYVGKASYINNVQLAAWDAVTQANAALDSVLQLEKELSQASDGLKFNFETKGRQTVRVFSLDYSKRYHALLNGMVERQMRHCIKMIGDVWYTAWVDAGQPDLKALINYQPTEEELRQQQAELAKWKADRIKNARAHEVDEQN
ncbi:MAG: S1/P1 Nuclease, partial [Cyclobacteriaceae bacterium]